MNNLFPPDLRTLSVVKRWSIVRTIGKDSVAEHSFFVTFYAVRIAQLLEWQGPLSDLMFYALMHDAEEAVTGDLISPVKRSVEDGAYLNFMAEQMADKLPLIGTQLDVIRESKWGDQIKAVVKVADKVEAYLFLIDQMRMGCTHLGPLRDDVHMRLREAWDDLFAALPLTHHATNQIRDAMWDNELYPALQAHYNHGSMGIT